jgi:hypothetical protein
LTSVLVVGGCSAGETQSIGFGTGYGAGCDLTGVASTFPAGGSVTMVATFSPLPSSVTVTMFKDDAIIYGPTSVTVDASLGCVDGTLPKLEVGHYRVVINVPQSQLPPLTGEFEVTP